MEEIWVDIEGYEGIYQVSNLGRVKSLERSVRNNINGGERIVKERILKLWSDKGGYLLITLCDKNRVKHKERVHRLVAKAFIPNPDNLPQVNHKDECKTNNCVYNLEWCTNEYNQFYGTKQERSKKNNNTNKQIVQLTLEGELVKIWDSIREANRNGFNRSCISECCNNKRQRTHKGYKWMYYEDYIKLNEKGE